MVERNCGSVSCSHYCNSEVKLTGCKVRISMDWKEFTYPVGGEEDRRRGVAVDADWEGQVDGAEVVVVIILTGHDDVSGGGEHACVGIAS